MHKAKFNSEMQIANTAGGANLGGLQTRTVLLRRRIILWMNELQVVTAWQSIGFVNGCIHVA